MPPAINAYGKMRSQNSWRRNTGCTFAHAVSSSSMAAVSGRIATRYGTMGRPLNFQCTLEKSSESGSIVVGEILRLRLCVQSIGSSLFTRASAQIRFHALRKRHNSSLRASMKAYVRKMGIQVTTPLLIYST